MFSIFRRRRPEPARPAIGSPEHRAQLVVDLRRRVAAILVEAAGLERQLAEHRAEERRALAAARSGQDPSQDLYAVVTAQDAQRAIDAQLAALREEEARLVRAIDEVRAGSWAGQDYAVGGRLPERAQPPQHVLDLGDPEVEARVRALQDSLGEGD